MSVVDFPAMVERAYADGVRVFVEHGPHAGCSKWIDEVLGPRPHPAVSLDRFGRSSPLQALDSVAALAAAGVPMNHRALAERLGPAPRTEKSPRALSGRRSFPIQIEPHAEEAPAAHPACMRPPTKRRPKIGDARAETAADPRAPSARLRSEPTALSRPRLPARLRRMAPRTLRTPMPFRHLHQLLPPSRLRSPRIPRPWRTFTSISCASKAASTPNS